ncbi:response regulator [Haloarcula litorea]|uniref:response regulator n=1 Tax=Haloarcula litorea TaxID=3032579 RepID=UPI0023E75E9D|nr:response regulator [Halomicroarcula sp. GDY20]
MTPPGESIRVLHVDDEPDFAEMSATFMERENDRIDVDTTTSPEKGLDYIRSDDIDCVVSDYDMPGLNGIEFLKQVRTHHPDLPFILFTGKGSEQVASEAISAGVTDYLQKGAGTEQYQLLTNRVLNAVEQYRSKQRAAALDRIQTLARNITQALVRAESRAEAESRVCEIISDAEPYLFAWIGDVDQETNRIEPRAWAGIDDSYLDNITITVDSSPTGQGPGGTAIRERRVAVSQNVAEDSEFEPWREDALERGYQAAAAVPLTYENTLYGELVVYAERPDAFDENERKLLAELGTDIARTFHSLELRDDLRVERCFVDQALDTLPEIFYVIGTDGRFRRWNDRLLEVTGYTDQEIADIQVIDLFPEDEHEQIAEAIEGALSTGRNTVKTRLLTASGDQIPYAITGARLTDPENDPVGIVGIGREIAES